MIDPHSSPWEDWLHKWFIPLLIPAILVNAGGLWIDILEPDGALYATIAKTIAQTGDLVNLRVEGKDWLDKPHFPFWMAAFSMRIFGINGFAYKFPALLFWAAGAWYTYRLALSLYGKSIAQLSVLIYVSAAHLVISNNDVRAEPYLTGLVIGSVYHFYKASRVRPGWHLVAGSLLAGCALMTKGPFVLLTISAGFILDWVLGKEWEQFRNIRWWIAVILTGLFTLPELICLYLQFDIHPEKVIYGHTSVSGIRFFFWDSQFGRFFNTGPIKGAGDPFFYFHTLLWAFLPWSLLLYAAIVQKCRKAGANRTASLPGGLVHRIPGDKICLGAAVASFALFSLSRFQLPHYLNILFPFFAILTAEYLYNVRRKGSQKAIRIIQGVITILLPALLLLLTWLFHFQSWVLILVVLLLLSLLPFRLFRGDDLPVPFARSLYMALLVFAFVNFLLYPAILHYQAGTQAGRFIGRRQPVHPGPNGAIIYMLEEAPADYSMEFYCPLPVQRIPTDSLPALLAAGPARLFVPSVMADTFAAKGYHIINVRRYPNFHISQLTGEFVNYHTRDSAVEWYSILKIGR